ncbi:2-isopropylmalate synthase [Halobacterium salinarum]|uniref:LeuA family protein n=1 Tax=Halobacterium salinarum TaxID=2242 RepID=UPI0025527E39|nr:2-isopropylmalate synthase [Halobacterium salinarum]MDL0130929.1 2-isopropylmalate synthase [Halobacterium salinarum]MDL0132098.1 2-isopropylmalate synthase [Halobacterium salinarum]
MQVRGNGFFEGTLAQRNEFESVRVFDTTLRDGEQTPRTSFSYDDKLAVAAALDDANVDVVEAGFPANGDAEAEAVADVADATDATTCGLARVVESDVEAALDAGVDMVHVFASTSDVQIEDSMHSTRDEVTERSVAAVERAADAGVEVMFSPMDATRTDPEYLAKVVEAVDDAGVDWVNVPDTCGVATPRRFGDLIEFVGEHTDARIDVHTHDDFGLATANALAGVEAGADQVQVSVNGIGERAGNAAFEEVVMSAESVYGADTGVDTTAITDVAELVAERSSVPVPVNKPVVGANAFAHESGIHAAGVIENSETFEPGVMTPEMVGAEREVVLGKHSGTHAVRQHLEDAGFAPTDDEVRAVTRKVKAHAADDQAVTEKVLKAFAGEVGVHRERGEVTA